MKKHVITNFIGRNPVSSDNISTGFALGQKWFNNVSGEYFYQQFNGIWKSSGIDVNFDIQDTVATKLLGINTATGKFTINTDKVKPGYRIYLPSSTSVAERCAGLQVGDYPTGWVLQPWAPGPNDLEIIHNLNRELGFVTVWEIIGNSRRLLTNSGAYGNLFAVDKSIFRIENLTKFSIGLLINVFFND